MPGRGDLDSLKPTSWRGGGNISVCSTKCFLKHHMCELPCCWLREVQRKKCSPNEFYFNTLNVTNVTLFFSIKLSLTLSPRSNGWWEIQGLQGLPKNPMGRAWQRLSDGWKSTAWPRAGARVLAEAGLPYLVSSVLKNTTPLPVWAL